MVIILRIADEVMASGQILNLRAAARRIDSFVCHTVFHLVGHAGDFAVAAALGGGRDTDQAVRSFLRGFADAPRCGHGLSAAVRPFAGLGCDANGVIARVRGGVAGDVHCGGIIAVHGRGMHRAVIGICSRYADVGLCGIGGRGRCIFLEDGFNLHVGTRHSELVVLDGHAAADDLPLLEVVAGVGRCGQGNLRAGNSLCRRCGSRSAALCGHSDSVLRGCGRRILLKNGLDLHVVVRHGELIVLDAHAAADDLPLLEVIALVGRSAQCDLRTGNSLCGRCRSRAVAAAGHGDGMLGRRRRRVLLEDCLDLYIAVRHGELVVGDYKSCRRFDLPLLEVIALVGRSAQGDLRTGRSLCMRGGSRSVAVIGHGDGVLRRRRWCILLENCLDLYIAVRHGELVVGDYKSCRRFDLPLLEVIALVGRSAQGDLRSGNSPCGRCRSRSVAAAGHGDGVLGRRSFGYRNRQLLRIAARAVGSLDGEGGASRCGRRAADFAGVLVQAQTGREIATVNAPCDGRGAVGGQGLAVRLAHLAVRQGVRGDGHAMAAGSKLCRQLGYIRRNVIVRSVELTVAAKPIKVVAGISVGAGQTVGRRRGKGLAAFHNDLNILGTVTQLAAAKVEGNGFQSVRAQ